MPQLPTTNPTTNNRNNKSVATVSSTITPLIPLCWHISGVSELTRPETATTSGRTLLAVSKIAAVQEREEMLKHIPFLRI